MILVERYKPVSKHGVRSVKRNNGSNDKHKSATVESEPQILMGFLCWL